MSRVPDRRVMLEELSIRDLGVVDDATLRPSAGLTVVTGETGAGKTMVVAALELLLGGRASSGVVRRGAEVTRVEAALHPPPPGAGDWVEPDEDVLYVTREVREGRSRARVGGRLAPNSALAALLADVVQVHGQADTSRLSEPSVQRDLLDRFGGEELAAALQEYRRAFAAWRDARVELDDLIESERERAREADRLAFELSEIDAVAPEAGEEEPLEAELRRLEHAESLEQAARGGAAALGDDGGARDALGASGALLRGVQGVDAVLDELAARTDALAAEAQELTLDLSRYADTLGVDPERVELLRARHAALARLVRKYGPDAEGVARYGAQTRDRLEQLTGSEERRDALQGALEDLRRRLDIAAEQLRQRRRLAGGLLAAEVDRHLHELAMQGAHLSVEVQPRPAGADGADEVRFLLAANPGEPAVPLGRAASGGERSRVALALRLALADADDAAVLVFDEIDAGIGGQVGLAVGRKLAALARDRQVLCVTHLAQLAAFADQHALVRKTTISGRTRADLQPLDDDARVGELSRMLSGTPDEPVAREHAAQLRALAVADVARSMVDAPVR